MLSAKRGSNTIERKRAMQQDAAEALAKKGEIQKFSLA